MGAKGWLKSRLPASVHERMRRFKFRHGYRRGKRTWSQEGEDMIVRRLLKGRDGFYVDIGAHHPWRYSNTHYLFRRGWQGINVDALPEAIELFEKARPGDCNRNVGIAGQAGRMRYYRFQDPAYNTFDEVLAREVEATVAGARIVDSVEIETMSLTQLLQAELPAGRQIGLMNVDVEGLDLAVLQSNDWERFRPSVLLVEIQWKSVEATLDTELYQYLAARDYLLYAKCVNTAVFLDRRAVQPGGPLHGVA